MKIISLIRRLYAPQSLGEGLNRVRKIASSGPIMDGSTQTETVGIYSKKYLGRNVTAEMTTDFYGKTRVVISGKNGKGVLASVIDRANKKWEKISYNIINFKKKTRTVKPDGIDSQRETLKPDDMEREIQSIKKRI